jgi:hypothetical protein
MLICRLSLLAILLLGTAAPSRAVTLKEAYDRAGPRDGYDRWVELEPGVVYTGGLQIGPSLWPHSGNFVGEPGCDVRIVGHGAVLDLQGQRICVSYCTNRLDLDDCVVLNGDVRFRGFTGDEFNLVPVGSVRHVTFYRPEDYGVRLQRCGAGILLERNLVVDAVDTGPDFIYTHGAAHDRLPTGASFSSGVTEGAATVRENWSWHSDPAANADPLRHFSFLCEYG